MCEKKCTKKGEEISQNGKEEPEGKTCLKAAKGSGDAYSELG